MTCTAPPLERPCQCALPPFCLHWVRSFSPGFALTAGLQGVAYEKLLKGPTSPPPNGEIMWNVSILGALLLSLVHCF